MDGCGGWLGTELQDRRTWPTVTDPFITDEAPRTAPQKLPEPYFTEIIPGPDRLYSDLTLNFPVSLSLELLYDVLFNS